MVIKGISETRHCPVRAQKGLTREGIWHFVPGETEPGTGHPLNSKKYFPELCELRHITQFLLVSVPSSLSGGDQLQEKGSCQGSA